MKKPSHDRIYLLPEGGAWCWANSPAPGIGQSDDDAVEYVRADLFDQVVVQRDSAMLQLETARAAINNNFNQLREHADKMQAQRDTAWQELREIREAIGANPEESTADEVRRVVSQKENLHNAIGQFQAQSTHWHQQSLQLAAELASLAAFRDEVVGVMNNSQGVSGWHHNHTIATWDELFPVVPDFESPAQCLRDIQADAVLAVIEFFPACRDIDIDALQSYAERVKAGE